MVRGVDAAVPVSGFATWIRCSPNRLARPKFLARAIDGSFAGRHCYSQASATYGVLSYMVTERRREIGIRVALGASRTDVLTQFMKQGFKSRRSVSPLQPLARLP